MNTWAWRGGAQLHAVATRRATVAANKQRRGEQTQAWRGGALPPAVAQRRATAAANKQQHGVQTRAWRGGPPPHAVAQRAANKQRRGVAAWRGGAAIDGR